MPLVLMIITLSAQFVASVSVYDQPTRSNVLDLILLHNNDMHARFEQTDRFSGNCGANDAQNGKCYGGFARVSSVVKQFRSAADNGGPAVLYFNAGDSYTGTPWFSIFKHKIVADFMNVLKPDAMVSISGPPNVTIRSSCVN